MSQQIESALSLQDDRATQDAEFLKSALPKNCYVPGYWTTLAKNTDDWAPEISAGPFWREANMELEGWKKAYRREFGGALYTNPIFPSFVGKSAERIEQKTKFKLRGFADQENAVKLLFDQLVPVPRIEDLVRVRLQVQFLDGVPFLASRIHEIAKKYDATALIEAKGKLDGYFAQHVSFRLPVHYRFNGQTTSCDVTCEVQIATSLATLVWENSHGLYENTRSTFEKPEEWQWSPSDPRFLSRQLGHMIHLADGLFCNLRDSK